MLEGPSAGLFFFRFLGDGGMSSGGVYGMLDRRGRRVVSPGPSMTMTTVLGASLYPLGKSEGGVGGFINRTPVSVKRLAATDHTSFLGSSSDFFFRFSGIGGRSNASAGMPGM